MIKIYNLLLDLLGTTEETSTAGGNETDLLTGHGTTGDSGGLTNVLVVTTTVRVINRVHGNTTSAGPRVALDLVLVVGVAGLEKGLVDTATAGDDTDDTTSVTLDDLLGTRGQLDTGLALVGVVTNDNDVVTRGAGESTTVADLVLDVRHDGTLRDGAEGQDVADGKGSGLTGVDELASVKTLVGNEGLGVVLVLARVTEHDLGERGAPTGVVDDLLHKTTGVAAALGVVERAELSSTLSQTSVGLEDSTVLSLRSDNTTHLVTKKV